MRILNLTNETKEEVNKLIKEQPSLVRFHSLFCGHCLSMSDDWNKLEKELKDKKDNVVIISIEGDNSENFDGFKDIMGFPTIVKLNKGGDLNEEYSGDRSFKSLMDFVSSKKGGSKKGKRKTNKHKKHNKKTRKHNKKTKKHNKKTKKHNKKVRFSFKK